MDTAPSRGTSGVRRDPGKAWAHQVHPGQASGGGISSQQPGVHWGCQGCQGNPFRPPLTACSCRARSFFSWVTLTCVSSSSWRLASAVARAPRSPRSSARRAASSSSACAERSSGFILKKSFIHDQFLTALKARIFHWMVNRASLGSGRKWWPAGCVVPFTVTALIFPDVLCRSPPPARHCTKLFSV